MTEAEYEGPCFGMRGFPMNSGKAPLVWGPLHSRKRLRCWIFSRHKNHTADHIANLLLEIMHKSNNTKRNEATEEN